MLRNVSSVTQSALPSRETLFETTRDKEAYDLVKKTMIKRLQTTTTATTTFEYRSVPPGESFRLEGIGMSSKEFSRLESNLQRLGLEYTLSKDEKYFSSRHSVDRVMITVSLPPNTEPSSDIRPPSPGWNLDIAKIHQNLNEPKDVSYYTRSHIEEIKTNIQPDIYVQSFSLNTSGIHKDEIDLFKKDVMQEFNTSEYTAVINENKLVITRQTLESRTQA